MLQDVQLRVSLEARPLSDLEIAFQPRERSSAQPEATFFGNGSVNQPQTEAAILVRVSDPDQHGENQLPDLQAWAERRGLEVVVVYQFQESAWKGAHQKQLTQILDDAKAGKFQVLLCWAMDRLSREGPLATLEIVHRLGRYGVTVASLQEPWVEVSGELRDLLLAITGWVARMESNRRSERTRAGLQ